MTQEMSSVESPWFPVIPVFQKLAVEASMPARRWRPRKCESSENAGKVWCTRAQADRNEDRPSKPLKLNDSIRARRPHNYGCRS